MIGKNMANQYFVFKKLPELGEEFIIENQAAAHRPGGTSAEPGAIRARGAGGSSRSLWAARAASSRRAP